MFKELREISRQKRMFEWIWHIRYEDIDSFVNETTRDENVYGFRLVKVEIARRYGKCCDLKMQFVYNNEYCKQKLAVLRTENLDDDEVYTEIVKTIESFKDQDYTLQFRYDKEFRKRKFVVLCFEK